MSTISYSRKGAGEPVVLIHGIGHRRSAWFEVYDRLAEQYDVIAVDLPGFGESPAPVRPGSYAMLSYAEQLEELFTELHLGRPHIVGNSLGGFLGLTLAARGSIATCTALSPAGFFNLPGRPVAGAALLSMKAASHGPKPVLRLAARKTLLRRIAMATLYVHPERLDPQVAYADTLNLRTSPGFWPVFRHGMKLKFDATTQVPVSIGWGDKDRLLLPSQAKIARRRLPQAHHETLPGCGHVPMLDEPALIVDLVTRTIARAASTTPVAVGA